MISRDTFPGAETGQASLQTCAPALPASVLLNSPLQSGHHLLLKALLDLRVNSRLPPAQDSSPWAHDLGTHGFGSCLPGAIG